MAPKTKSNGYHMHIHTAQPDKTFTAIVKNLPFASFLARVPRRRFGAMPDVDRAALFLLLVKLCVVFLLLFEQFAKMNNLMRSTNRSITFLLLVKQLARVTYGRTPRPLLVRRTGRLHSSCWSNSLRIPPVGQTACAYDVRPYASPLTCWTNRK